MGILNTWWVKLAVWIIAFATVSQLSPDPIYPAIFFVASVVYWVLVKTMWNRGSGDKPMYYRGA